MDPVVIDPQFIDVDFEEFEPGDPQFSGYLGESAGEQTFGISWPSWLERFPESEWHAQKDKQKADLGTDRIGRLYLDPWNDQTPQSSCVANAMEACFRYHWRRALGRAFDWKWSPMWTYQHIGWSQHSGSYTMDALRWVTEKGLCPEDESNRSEHDGLTLCHERSKALAVHSYHQNTPYEGQNLYPEFEATAKYFKARRWIQLNGVIEFASALLHRLPIVNGRSGHSICHCDLIWDGRQWLSEYLDSYDATAGDNGRRYDSRRMWSTSGAWALLDIYLPNNPIAPCDIKPQSNEQAAQLYPTLTEEQIDYYMAM